MNNPKVVPIMQGMLIRWKRYLYMKARQEYLTIKQESTND